MSETSEAAPQASPATARTGARRRLTGRVTSDKAAKTVTVLVERKVKHPLYGKYVTRSKKYHAHTETGGVGTGDLVLIEECRPISKTKTWLVVEVLEKARIV